MVLRVYAPKTCQAKETSINYIVASSWLFTLFHYEDARPNNPQTAECVCEWRPPSPTPLHSWVQTVRMWSKLNRSIRNIHMGRQSACCVWCSVRYSLCDCVNLLSVSVVVALVLRPRVTQQVSLFFCNLLTVLCTPWIQSKLRRAVALWNKLV